MRTVGVDVAKSHKTTAVCTIRWSDDGADADAPQVPADDGVVLAAAKGPDVGAIAFDAPFGWPVAMVAAVSSWRPGGRWAKPEDHEFRLRRTDVFTAKHTKKPEASEASQGAVNRVRGAVPLSVSADKIAMAAWRCCALLSELTNAVDARHEVVTDAMGTPFSRDGRVGIVEAYPAAALSMWGIPRDGYKDSTSDAHRVRASMLAAIERAGDDGWLRVPKEVRAAYIATDHALDALVCALVARAAMLGLVAAVPTDDRAAARSEGWIALPRPDSLHALAARRAVRVVAASSPRGSDR